MFLFWRVSSNLKEVTFFLITSVTLVNGKILRNMGTLQNWSLISTVLQLMRWALVQNFPIYHAPMFNTSLLQSELLYWSVKPIKFFGPVKQPYWIWRRALWPEYLSLCPGYQGITECLQWFGRLALKPARGWVSHWIIPVSTNYIDYSNNKLWKGIRVSMGVFRTSYCFPVFSK